MDAQVLAVSVGHARPLRWRGRAITTAIVKTPTTELVKVDQVGLAGDEQGDRVHHGGPDKAVMAYPSEHYAAWSSQLGQVSHPAFGENLTTAGLLEEGTVLGSVYRVGPPPGRRSHPSALGAHPRHHRSRSASRPQHRPHRPRGGTTPTRTS